MTELQFVDELPEHRGKRGLTERRVKELKAHPNQWAKWPTKSSTPTVKKALRPFGDDFDVVSRFADGVSHTFVRYAPVDEPSTASANGNGHNAEKAAPPPETGGTRPKVKCPTCSQFINIEVGEDGKAALTRHERTNPVCKAANRRR